jgi:hypothetical protein
MARTRVFQAPNSMSALNTLLDTFQRNKCNMVFNSAALAIFGAASPNAKSVNAIDFIVDGVIANKAAATMPALGGATVPTGNLNVYVFTVDASGNLATLNGTFAATRAGIVWPTVPDGTVVLGFAIINNAAGSNFVPGTTPLDTASLTVTYVNTPFPFVPGLQNV